jgi:hypothetical protein
VWLDGAPVAYVRVEHVGRLMERLRRLKCVFCRVLHNRMCTVSVSDTRLPNDTELAFVPRSSDIATIRAQCPGVYIFTESARLVRPVNNCVHERRELIGTFEQVYLPICIRPEEAIVGVTQHQEIAPNALFRCVLCGLVMHARVCLVLRPI